MSFSSQFKATLALIVVVLFGGVTLVNQMSLQKQINELKTPAPAVTVVPTATPSATLIPTRVIFKPVVTTVPTQ